MAKNISIKPGYKKFSLAIVFTLLSSVGLANSDRYHLETEPVKFDKNKPDFRNIKDVNLKKKTFINYMSKEIDEANKEICIERDNVLKLQKLIDDGKELTKQQKATVDAYNKFYKIENTKSIEEQLNNLAFRVNIAPKSLVIAQAILETGWGTSRFAVDYNNYFGLHCFEQNCGIRAKDADVQVETFKDVGDSVLGYYSRLNTGSKFKDFRKVREEQGIKSSDTSLLINTLGEYSSLKDNEYATRLESVIKYNNLDEYSSSCS